MTSRKRNLRFIPRLESLEHREVPAGNVYAALVGRNLEVTGDAASNMVGIVGNGTDSVSIFPLDSTTTINGQSKLVPISGITGSVYINMGDGNNNVEISRVSSSQDFWVTAGTGNNTIGLANVYSAKSLNVATTGFGNDTIYLNFCYAVDQLMVNAAAGTDNVSVSNSTFGANSSIRDAGTNSWVAIVNDKFGANFAMSGFTLGSQNLNPIAAANTATVASGASVNINVVANDRAVTAGLLPGGVAVTALPAHGTATVNGDGSITYKNDGSPNAADSFSYAVADILGNVSNVATVAITVTAVNPVAGPVSAAVTEGQAVTIDLGKNTTVSTGTLNLASLAITTPPATGTIKINADGTVVYTQNGNFATSDTFQYTFADSTGKVSNPGTVTVTVTPTDHVPVAANASPAKINPSASTTVDLGALATDADGASDLDLTSIKIVTQPAHGAVVVNANGTVKYTHDGSATSADSFTYTISDQKKAVSNVATVSIAINQLTAAITTTEPSPTSVAAIPFTATFSEGVTGFAAANVISNGTVGSFVAVSPTTYTFTVAPAADGLVTVSINAGVATGTVSGLTNVAAVGNANSVRTAAGMTATIPDITSPNFVPLGTQGLKVWDVQAGTGTAVTSGSTVTVFYRGWLASNGTLFDSSLTTGSPAVFALSNLIQGFQQGAIGMKPGGIRRVFIPSALGYGAAGQGSIPPNADLVFEIKLLATT